MIYAKLTTPIQHVDQSNPLSPVTKSATHLTVIANRYELGADQATFTVRFGTLAKNESNQITGLNQLFQISHTLTGTDLAGWGTDDTVVLTKIAQAKGFSIQEFVNA